MLWLLNSASFGFHSSLQSISIELIWYSQIPQSGSDDLDNLGHLGHFYDLPSGSHHHNTCVELLGNHTVCLKCSYTLEMLRYVYITDNQFGI